TPAYGSRTAAVDLAAGAPARAVGVRLTGLTPGTTYHARLVVHGLAAAGGESRSFATLVPPPIVTPGTGAPDGPATVPPPVGPTVPTPVLPPAPVGDPPPPTPPVVRAGTGARAVATLTVVSGRRVRGAVVLRLRASAAGTLRVRAGSRLLVAVRVRRPGVVTVRLRPARTVRRVTAELTPTGSARPVRRTVRLPA
ncbi:MAG: Transcriptional regulator, IclR family, partial [uncultured Thermoleophilia bacterium]